MVDDELKRRAEGRIGSVLCGKYRIEQVLGVGGMAVVYAATHRNQKRVAIKMLHPELTLNREVRARFMREGYAANTVDHPGAVAVLDDDTAEDGAAFLVMERLEGGEVDDLRVRHGGRFDARVVLAIADALLAVLAAAHAKAIVHRDIKPENLYLLHDGTLKVLDFGIARARDALSDGQGGTKTGMLMGTPAYMAPEQALGKSKDIDGMTDVWAVGATLFTLLSGQQVHDGETATAILVSAASRPARSLSAVAPDVDGRVVALVDRALAFDKAARWPSAADMRAAVRETYLVMFGSNVSKEPLEQLSALPMGHAATMLAPSNPPPAGSVPPMASGIAASSQNPSQPSFPNVAGARAMTPAPQTPMMGMPPPGMGMPPPGMPGSWPGAPGTGAPWVAPGTQPPMSAAPAAPARGTSFVLPAVILGLAILGGAGIFGIMASRRGDAAPVDAASAQAPPSASAPRTADTAAPTSTADATASSPAVPASIEAPAPRTVVVVRPAGPVPTAPAAPTPVAPAVTPAPTPTPVPAAPPPPCRAQCKAINSYCHSQCSGPFRERHECKKACDRTELACSARAPC